MQEKPLALFIFLFCSVLPAYAGIMRHDISVQEYRDFAENLGCYRPGALNTPVYLKNNALAGILPFPLPDFSPVITQGYATIISPSYIVSVRHNGGYQSVTWGDNAKFSPTSKLINRNNHLNADFHAPRVNKVIVDAASMERVTRQELIADPARYAWYTRVGAGTQSQVNDSLIDTTKITNAYIWKTGGVIPGSDTILNTMLRGT